MDKLIEKKNPNRRIWAVIVVVIATGIVTFSLDKLNFDSIFDLDEKRIIVSTVERNTFGEYIRLRATVESSISVFIDAVESGRVESIMVEENEIVAEGDVILTLNNARLQLDVIAREAQATEQLNNLRNTQLALEQNTLNIKEEIIDSEYRITALTRDLVSAKELFIRKVISSSNYEKLVEDLSYWKKKQDLSQERLKHDQVVRVIREKQLASSISMLENNLLMSRSVLDSLVIRAPRSGKLTSLNIEIGESKLQGENLGIIDGVGDFKATSSVSEYYINKVNVEQKAELEVGGKKFVMVVDKIFPEVNNSQFKIELSFKGKSPSKLKRGQALSLKLSLGSSENAVVMDNGPFFNDTGGAWVFVLNKLGDEAIKRRVTFGRKTPEFIEVINGLLPGDRVITSSYHSFLDAEFINITGG
jgi:HlyD family secretion protein